MYVSIDLGGTNTRVASSENLESIYRMDRFPTARNLSEQRDKISETVLEVSNGRVDHIVMGVPGTFDIQDKRFVRFSNYHELDGLNFTDLFTDELKTIPLTVENDAVLAGLAEAVMGIGRDYSSVAYITLSTGIGGTMIIDKKISRDKAHIEPGHFIINEDSDLVDGWGIRGSFEALSSGSAFEKIYGIKPEDCDDDDTWRQYGYFLGTGMLTIIRLWWPDVVILGGGISNKFLHFFPGIMERFAKETNYEIPPILKSELMDEAGLKGGFVLMKQLKSKSI